MDLTARRATTLDPRFIIYGAGAIGATIGALLLESGADVGFIARGAHLAAMKERGLRFEQPGRTPRTLHVTVHDGPETLDLRSGDVVLLCVKSQHSAEALERLAAVAPPDLAVACVQNGVDNERLALRYFRDVYGVCVLCPAAHLEPGVVAALSSAVPGVFEVGRYPGGADEVAAALAATLCAAGFDALVRNDVMAWKRAKLLANLDNALDVVFGPEVEATETSRLARAEGEAALAAASLDFIAAERFVERRKGRIVRDLVGGVEFNGSSTWQSLRRGTGNLETDFLNGEIVLLGRLHGVATPVNEALQWSCAEILAGRPPAADEVTFLAEMAH